MVAGAGRVLPGLPRSIPASWSRQAGPAAAGLGGRLAAAALGGGRASGLGRPIAQLLVAAGEPVVDVPAELTARARLLGTSKQATDFHRIADRRGTGIGRVAAARKLLTLICHGLRDGQVR